MAVWLGDMWSQKGSSGHALWVVAGKSSPAPSISQHLVLGGELSRSRRCGPKVPRFETNPHLVLSCIRCLSPSLWGRPYQTKVRREIQWRDRRQFHALDPWITNWITSTNHQTKHQTIVSRGSVQHLQWLQAAANTWISQPWRTLGDAEWWNPTEHTSIYIIDS